MKWMNSKALPFFFIEKILVKLHETSIRDHSNAVVVRATKHKHRKWQKSENFIGHLSLTIMLCMKE